MRRALKWIVPLVVLAEVVLVWSGGMDPRDAVLVVAGLEVLLFLVGLGGVVLVARRYREERKAGLDPWRALEDGLSLVLPRAVARLVVKEPRLFACLFRWAFRRVKLADNEFGYHKRSVLRAITPLVIVSAPMDLVVVHVLALAFSPWVWLKWALLVLGVYATLWLLGLYASLEALPHRLEATGVRLRHGVFAEGFVPYEGIEDAVLTVRNAPKSADGLRHAPEEDALYLATGGKTDVTLHLRAPRSANGFLKDSAPASVFHLAADEPDRLVRELRQGIEASASDSGAERPPAARKAGGRPRAAPHGGTAPERRRSQ